MGTSGWEGSFLFNSKFQYSFALSLHHSCVLPPLFCTCVAGRGGEIKVRQAQESSGSEPESIERTVYLCNVLLITMFCVLLHMHTQVLNVIYSVRLMDPELTSGNVK